LIEPASTIKTPLPYFVHRSASKNLPVYETATNGGTLRLTRIRKLEGNLEVLRQQLISALDLDPQLIYIKNNTKHIIIRKHVKREVEVFLKQKLF
jgi:large subunit ribosomal protein L49